MVFGSSLLQLVFGQHERIAFPFFYGEKGKDLAVDYICRQHTAVVLCAAWGEHPVKAAFG